VELYKEGRGPVMIYLSKAIGKRKAPFYNHALADGNLSNGALRKNECLIQTDYERP
jgi:hypothetical protein